MHPATLEAQAVTQSGAAPHEAAPHEYEGRKSGSPNAAVWICGAAFANLRVQALGGAAARTTASSRVVARYSVNSNRVMFVLPGAVIVAPTGDRGVPSQDNLGSEPTTERDVPTTVVPRGRSLTKAVDQAGVHPNPD